MKMNINWDLVTKIAVIIGLIWAFIAFIKGIMAYIDRKKMKGLEGFWHEYHWTNPDGANSEFKWLHSELRAIPRFFSSYKLVYKNNDFEFIGKARYIDKKDIESNGDILLKLQHEEKAQKSKETIYFRYNIPERQFGENNDEIAGIWLSYNFGKEITSGASILSRKRIPQNELDAKFEEYFEYKKASIVVKSHNATGGKKSFWERFINSIR